MVEHIVHIDGVTGSGSAQTAHGGVSAGMLPFLFFFLPAHAAAQKRTAPKGRCALFSSLSGAPENVIVPAGTVIVRFLNEGE